MRTAVWMWMGLMATGSGITRAESPLAVLDSHTLSEVTVEGHYDNAVGTSDAASAGTISKELLKSRPALRPAEVLEFIPGMIVTQHSGDGKANQYFLRGYNLDHGTDFATSVDGIPVNMPTHAHGQGYTDLNFLIPELVSRIDYRKGPYFARNGDFSSAGSADINYSLALPEPLAQLTLGERGYRRALLAGSTTLSSGQTLLGAFEAQAQNGPWTVPEGLRKLNGLLKLSDGSAARGWSATLQGYDAHWRSTDQVPLRAVESGRIGRFDAIDPTDGGSTSRYSLSGEWHDRGPDGDTSISVYALRYRLSLFSNFTYFLDNSVDGDQFEQRDSRTVVGGAASRSWRHTLGGFDSRTEVGAQLRQDRVHLGLYDTVAQQRIGTTREDAVRESSLGVYVENQTEWLPWFRTVAGLRGDTYRFNVASALPDNSGKTTASRVSPKLSAVFGPWAQTEFFINAGNGFHSNDARGTTARIDPRSGEPVTPVPGLVGTRGWELGARTEIVPGLQSSLALWTLSAKSELVYVGDAGTTEANRPSRRQGVEWSNRWIPMPWLLFDADLAWTHARFTDYDPIGDRIPGAVERVASIAATVRDVAGWSASLQWRYLGARPLIEDNTVRAKSTLLTNLRLSRKLTPKVDLTLDVFNLLNRKVNDIEYYYASRLRGEAAPVNDVHFHPGEPRTVRVTAQMRF